MDQFEVIQHVIGYFLPYLNRTCRAILITRVLDVEGNKMNEAHNLICRKNSNDKFFEENNHYLEKQIKQVCENHPIWDNKLLLSFESGDLNFEEMKFIFSQYYYYSMNFTKLLAAGMVKCDSCLFRSKLSQNLWEEAGELEIEKRHSQIFKIFLTNTLKINIDKIKFEKYTTDFFDNYLNLILNSKSSESISALAFATEGIVPTLYSKFIKGLSAIGISKKELEFFHIHVDCDDDHAETLKQIALSQSNEKNWLDDALASVRKCLDIRNDFFDHIYESIRSEKIRNIIASVINQEDQKYKLKDAKVLNIDCCKERNLLYKNAIENEGINFYVNQIDIPSDSIDTRILHINSNSKTECHRHAHESVFYVLEGKGTVKIDKSSLEIHSGDIVYVPRWVLHQTINLTNSELKILAITDYGLTGLFKENQHKTYRRLKKI